MEILLELKVPVKCLFLKKKGMQWNKKEKNRKQRTGSLGALEQRTESREQEA